MGLLQDNSLGGQPVGYTWGDQSMPAIPPEVAFQEALKRLNRASDYASAASAGGANPSQVYQSMAEHPARNDMDTYSTLNAERNARLLGDTSQQNLTKDRIEFEQTQARQAAVNQMLQQAIGGQPQAAAAAGPANVAAGPANVAAGPANVAAGGQPQAGAPAPRSTTNDPFGIGGLTKGQLGQILLLPPDKQMAEIIKLTSKSFEPVKIQTDDGRDMTMYKRSDGTLLNQQQAQAAGLQIPGGGNPYSNGKMTDSEATANTYANRMASSHALINNHEAGGMSRLSNGIESIPILNSFQGEEQKLFQQARDNFITAMLRRESGAAISSGEYVQAYKTFIPQPGDPESVLKQKAQARAQLVESNLGAAGPNGQRPVGWEQPNVAAHAQVGRLGVWATDDGQHFEMQPDGRLKPIGVSGGR